MQHRIAQIVTEFRTTGLPAIRDALRNVINRINQVRAAAQRGLGSVARAAAPAAKALGKVALAAGAATAALAAMAKGSALAFIHQSVEDTVEDLKQLRQTAALTKMSPEFVSFWQRFLGQSGIEKEDVTAILGAFNTAVSEAVSDPESGFATLFKDMNVQLVDAQGNMRNLSHIFGDFAIKQRALSSQKRGFYLAQIFGDGDALKAGEAFDRIATTGVEGANAQYRQDLADGNLVTPEQVQIAKDYEKSVVSLKETYLALKRLIFQEVGPVLVKVFEGAERALSKSKKSIAAYFAGVFERVYRFALDIAVVIAGLDAEKWFGESNSVRSGWLYDVRELLVAIAELGKLAGRAILGALRAADDFFARISGFSVVDWARSFSIDDLEMVFRRGIRWVAAFIRDIRDLLTGVWNDRDLETGLGEWLGLALQWISDGVAKIGAMIMGEFDKVVSYIRRAWTEFTTADAAGTGVAGMSTALGVMLITVKDVADAVSKLLSEFKKVFILGGEADAGFEWIEELHNLLTRVMATVNSFMDIMKGLLAPLQAVLEMFGSLDAAAVVLAGTIVAKLVASVFSLINMLSGGAIGASLTASLAGVGTGIAALAAPIAAFVAALGVAALAVTALWKALPESWQDGAMDTLGTSDRTMDAKFFDLRKENDASLYKYGIKPGALATWQAMNPNVGAPLGGGRFAEVGTTASDLRPVNINIAGAPPISARMTPSELDAARAASMRRYG